MSLRFRLILSILSIMLLSLSLGGALSGFHAVRSVHTEMQAALEVGTHTIENALPHLTSGNSEADLEKLIAAFDGDRHLRATLVGPRGNMIAASTLLVPADPVPYWFARLLGRDEPKTRVALPPNLAGGDSIILETDPQNEMTEVWTEFGDTIRTLLVFGVFSFPLIYWMLGRALQPLDRLSRAFLNVGSGDSFGHIDERGPPELADLARGFNAMVDRLAVVASKNQQLNEQLSMIQEEERAELARNLHDDFGPYLFAMGVDTGAIQRSLEKRDYSAIPGQLQSVQQGVTHIQQQVKAILGRLRSGSLAQFGLPQALANLAAFWRSRHPEVTIEIRIAANAGLTEAVEAAIYRIVQESLNNAMRHGRPRRVDVTIDASPEYEIVVEVSNDGDALKRPSETSGFGLRGMAERVTSLGGDLSVRDRAGGQGVIVTARLPTPTGMRIHAA